MATTIEELERFITVPRETPGLEFKEAKVQYDNTKLFRYCVAIANEGGGKLQLFLNYWEFHIQVNEKA